MNHGHSADADDHRRRYVQAIRLARQAGPEAFQSWFNETPDVAQAVLRGYWDFTVHILTPVVLAHIASPEDKTALEIGYGGGRILNAACSYFREAIGIDIHEEQQTVAAFLHSQGKHNFRLIQTGGRTIDVESESIDFVYSFIVLQHLPSMEMFESYLRETHRCLTARGVAQLYFGAYSVLSFRDQLRHLARGYAVIQNAPVNFISLSVRRQTVEQLCRRVGLRIIGGGHSYKRVPDGFPGARGGQDCVTLLKER